MNIREASREDWPAIWPIFHEVVKAGEIYAYDPATTIEQGEALWLDYPEAAVHQTPNQYPQPTATPGLSFFVMFLGGIESWAMKRRFTRTMIC